MQTYDEADQLSLFDPDFLFGRTFREPSPAESRRARTSASSWKRSSESKYLAFQSLDLTPGHGNLLGESYWELISPWRGDAWMRNTGVSPREESASSLSQILEETPRPKYFLTTTACKGILRRAAERGKELPEQLKLALMIQAGLQELGTKLPEMKAYHMNQRDEGIDLHGVSGALMATSNLQMQTFITGGSTPEHIAFAANQRDEVRDLHDVAGALATSHSSKQTTLVATFSHGAGPGAGGIGYSEKCAPTLKGSSGGNMTPAVLCLNDQGGQVMECSENVVGTLRAQTHGHEPLVLATQQGGAEIGVGICPTITASAGMSGNNQPVMVEPACYCITGNAIDRQPQNGGNGIGYREDVAYTLTATDHHAVFARKRVDDFREDAVASTQSARQHKDATDLVCQPYDVADTARLIRRLTPLECERLQGFPDGWTDIPGAKDGPRYKALGNSVAIPCVEFLMAGLAHVLNNG